MQIERSMMRNGSHHQFCSSDHFVDRISVTRERNNNNNNMSMSSSNLLLIPSSPPRMSSSSSSSPGGGGGAGAGVNFIEHHVSKMDTLAGVAIKYGVEVADIKRMNNLVTDLQMFALKSLQIPLPGRHPPSSSLNDSPTRGESSTELTPSRLGRIDVLESFQSLRLKCPETKVSPAMSSLQGYYGLRSNNNKVAEAEMTVYRSRAHYLEDEPSPKTPLCDAPLSKHRKSRSLVNSILAENGILTQDVPVSGAGDGESDKLNEKSVRRRQKTDIDSGSRTPEKLLKDDNNGGGWFSAAVGKGLALRPKSSSRLAPTPDSESSWLNPITVGLGESILANGIAAVRKSSSTSNLQDQENNSSSLSWAPWNLKPEPQPRSTASSIRPIFDGLPKPMSGRKTKAALD